MNVTKDAVLDAVASFMQQRFGVEAEHNKQFEWVEGAVVADLYLLTPLHCTVQFDDATHCTRERAATFANYPDGAPLNFDVRRYLADQASGDSAIAEMDMRADLVPPKHGFNPTVRIRADEIDELTGPMANRVESLLSRRLAFHAGTTFHLMLENAGAKPHHTHGA